MAISIHTETLTLDIYGFSGIAVNKDYAGTAFKLSGSVWQAIKKNGLNNKGKNIWVYGRNNEVFAGVELEDAPKADITLEHKKITLKKYAYCKHVGPYKLLPTVGQSIHSELKAQGFVQEFPYIEIYGHWSNDESKLETELFFSLK